jgi:hypothetical protein
MTVIRTWTVRPQFGRFDDTLAMLTEVAKIVERHHGTEMLLTEAGAAGANSGSLVLSCEFPDFTTYGTFVDEMKADGEVDAYMRRARAADAPYALVSALVAAEVPLDRTSTREGRGTVLFTYTGRSHPGRFDDTKRLACEAFDLIERHGATRCRLLQIGPGGELSGTLVAISEFDDMHAYGAATDAFNADPPGMQLLARLDAPGSPTEFLSSSLYTRIPLL